MSKRAGWFYFGCLMAFTGLLFRLFYLSIGENAKTAEEVVGNRTSELVLYRTKGLIYDEDLEPLAGGQPCKYAVVNPREFQQENVDKLLEGTEADEETVKEKLKKETPFVLPVKNEMFELPGVILIEGEKRYSGIASHLVGYLDSAGEVGLSGVEKEFDAILSLYSGKTTLQYSSDAVQGAISGLGVLQREENKTDNGIILSLNKKLCTALENSMDACIDIGAAIVMDCSSGELKAVSSRPDFDAENIASYLESENGELINRAFSAQTVGSVFKIVLAACAIEQGLEEFRYTCEGGILIGDHTFSCVSESGHGEIGLEEAFGQSCNCYFIALGQLLGEDCILDMAKRFGFGESIEVLKSISAGKGSLPEKMSRIELANLSIGQGALTASPLQIARMTSIVANGGMMPEIELYKGIYVNEKVKYEQEEKEQERVISEECAAKLRQLCVFTVEEGTGKAAAPSEGTAGGKTASAQTGIYKDGKEQLNVYFTGFYPADEPRYVITVFAENGVSGGKTCGPVFREICDFIAENGLTL